MTEAALIAGLRQGSLIAWAEVRRRYRRLIYHTVHQLLPWADGQDAEQHTWVVLLVMAPDLDPSKGEMRSLIYSIVKNWIWAEINEVRRARRAAREPWHESVEAPQEAQVEQNEATQTVLDLLTVATPPERAAIVAVYYLDLPHQAAADRLGISVNTMKCQIERCKHKMHARAIARQVPRLFPRQTESESQWPLTSNSKTRVAIKRKKQRAHLTLHM